MNVPDISPGLLLFLTSFFVCSSGGGMYDSWEVQLEDVYLYDVILQGSYGAVYKVRRESKKHFQSI